ncbi:MAG: heme-binding domain-containing protein [Candidatus Zixiibacteriota bacterium]
MTRQNLLMLMPGLMIPLLLSAGLLLAHGEKDTHESDSTKNMPSAPIESGVAARQDSLFAVINTEYNGLKPIFEKSCFDCHSKFTKFPWYHKIPGIKQLIDSDIKEGRKHLDLSDGFPFASHASLPETLEDMKEQVSKGEMPLLSYRLIHWGTGLSGARRDSVTSWLDSAKIRVIRFYDEANIPYEQKKSED